MKIKKEKEKIEITNLKKAFFSKNLKTQKIVGIIMTVAFALITVEPKNEKELIESLKKYKEIIKIWEVYGEYDIVAKIEIESPEKLNLLMTEKLRKEKGIKNTSTLLAFE